jgi:hypothetical protein
VAVPTSDIWSKLCKAVLDGFGTLRDIEKLGVVVESVDLPNNELHNVLTHLTALDYDCTHQHCSLN